MSKKNSVLGNQELVGPYGGDSEQYDEHHADDVEGDQGLNVVGEVVADDGGRVEGGVRVGRGGLVGSVRLANNYIRISHFGWVDGMN